MNEPGVPRATPQPAIERRLPLFIKVFVSSPGDVAAERDGAVRVLDELQRRPAFSGRVIFQAVRWDDQLAPVPISVQDAPQDAVNLYKGQPRDCDLTLVIVWSRLGTPTRVAGQAHASGTAFEYQDARDGGTPVWVYRRTEEPQVPLGDKKRLLERLEQYERLQEFVAGLETEAGEPAFTNDYSTPVAFEALLSGHLEHWLVKQLDKHEAALRHSGVRELAADTGSKVPATSRSAEFAARGNIPPAGNAPYVGRQQQLERLRRSPEQQGVRLVAVTGESGVGKSELCLQHARTQRADYPGGQFLIRFPSSGVPTDLAQLAKQWLGAAALEGFSIDEQCQSALAQVARVARDGSGATLLIYDNVPCEDAVLPWLPAAGSHIDVIVSSTFSDFSERWERVTLRRLDDATSRQLVVAVGGEDVARQFGNRIVAIADGLPIELLPLTRAVRRQHERLRPVALHGPSTATKESFASLWQLLDPDAQVLLRAAALFVPERVPELDLKQLLVSDGWDDERFETALGAAMDQSALSAVQAGEHFKLHALLRRYLTGLDGLLSEVVLNEHGKRFSDLSRQYDERPNDTALAGRLMAYPADVEFWRGLGADVFEALDDRAIGEALQEQGRFEVAQRWYELGTNGEQAERADRSSFGTRLHQVGECLHERGEYEAARGWYERAVREKEQGDGEGRVDHTELGKSLHQVGYCLSMLDEYEAAQGWSERAVWEAEQGNVDGRVDHVRLGESLHQVGYCLSSLGKNEAAQGWVERAVREFERGDAHGRVDHSLLGASLHQVGWCLHERGESEAAQGWYERAVREHEQGDVHGRVNHAELGRSLHQVGWCLSSLGKHKEAQGWYERAALEQERGDVHGRVNHTEVGVSLHQVGWCLSSQWKPEAARGWYERAVREHEQGDVHGGVDHTQLGQSLHQVGNCLSSLGKHEAAQSWYERAVREHEHGDGQGRVDHSWLGASLRRVGNCLSSLGKPEAARSWYERAVREEEQGDIHGRVDRASLTSALESLRDVARHLSDTTTIERCERRLAELQASEPDHSAS